MLAELDDYDWKEAFAYAGAEPDTCNNGHPDLRAALGSTVELVPFTRADVAEVVALSPGENDGPCWMVYGRLNDGRWFFLEAGCDYTGWDCQAGGSATLAVSRDELERLGMTAEARRRLGVSEPA